MGLKVSNSDPTLQILSATEKFTFLSIFSRHRLQNDFERSSHHSKYPLLFLPLYFFGASAPLHLSFTYEFVLHVIDLMVPIKSPIFYFLTLY